MRSSYQNYPCQLRGLHFINKVYNNIAALQKQVDTVLSQISSLTSNLPCLHCTHCSCAFNPNPPPQQTPVALFASIPDIITNSGPQGSPPPPPLPGSTLPPPPLPPSTHQPTHFYGRALKPLPMFNGNSKEHTFQSWWRVFQLYILELNLSET